MKRATQKLRNTFKRYPFVVASIILAVAIIGGTGYYVAGRNPAAASIQQDFDPNSVLPPAVSQPEASTVYTKDSLAQFDGKDGHKCYVAIKQTVYEIKDNRYWQNGEHTPSGGRGVCGGDMTEVIKQSPHGESVLEQLPKVGIYKG